MLRVAICDDDKSFLSLLHQTLLRWITYHNFNINILLFENGEDLLYDIEEAGHFQIVFIEIELNKMDGLTIAYEVYRQCPAAIIIFTSATDYCNKHMYKVHPFYFFTKPIKDRELFFVMKKALKRLDIECQTFRFFHKAYYYSVPVKEIIYFFSDGRKVGIVSLHKKYYFYGKLDLITNEIQKKASVFLRIHKSYLVNKRYITIYQSDFIEVKGNELLPISRSHKKAIRNILAKEWKEGHEM
ncbi:MAG: LytTR family DNA-binding domain-containing protein [Lachnospiraceae bacterium]|nr:LytTR family DNA-binding domain-containing protein [Lachnospiraceae bacterium]